MSFETRKKVTASRQDITGSPDIYRPFYRNPPSCKRSQGTADAAPCERLQQIKVFLR
ncbi:MAG: hypothetical protein JRI33_03310 [Deltaproteobacteria bacterium]|nr:hypothetical protein [Deltaproteobacteria bacterium]